VEHGQHHSSSSHSHDSHDDEDHGHGGGEEPIIVKKMSPNETVAQSLNAHGVIAEPVAHGTHPLEGQPCYSHKFSSNPRFTTNKGMVKIRNRNFDLVQVVQKH
jgi:hypothetical protein